MIKILITLFTLVTLYSIAQNELDPNQQYQIDTIIKSSSDYPDSYDTLIVYKKINVIHQKRIVIDSIERHSYKYWFASLEAQQEFGKPQKKNEEIKLINFNIKGVAAALYTNIYTYKLGLSIGLHQQRFTQNKYIINESIKNIEQTIIDTVDIYYISDGDGEYSPRYIIKEHTETLSDTSYIPLSLSIPSKITFANFKIFGIKEIELQKWKFGISLAYKIGLPVSNRSLKIYPATETEDIIAKVSTQHSLETALRINRQLSSRSALYLSGKYCYQMTSYVNNENLRYQLLGIQLGIQIQI